jgi:hypothetical protein
MRLYKAQDVTAESATDFEDEEGSFDTIAWDERKAPSTEAEGAPAGWDQHCIDVWGEPHEFFTPSDRRIYRSRSSAQERVDLINRWGGKAVLVEADVNWVPVEIANRRRKAAKIRAKRDRLEHHVRVLEAQLRTMFEEDA